MIYLVETISLLLIASLCIICTISDIHQGIIYNKVLVVFAVIAVFIDSIYYGLFARNLIVVFFQNFLICFILCLCLFFLHFLAGGDCKMLIVLALIYPARFYFFYGKYNVTFFFVIGYAIIAGYLFFLATAIKSIVHKNTEFNKAYVKKYLNNFGKSYISAMIYITLLNCMLVISEIYGLIINIWIFRCICILVAYCVGRYYILRKTSFLLPIAIMVGILSIKFQIIPITLKLENYILVLVILLCQMTMKTCIYEKVYVEQLKKGMILSTFSSILMQSSITKGLPGVSSEDLKSRLTENEVECIKIWAKATHTKEIYIVKKIPFAIFISIGILCYFILWRISI